LTLEDGLLHGLTRSPSHMAAREDRVDIFYYYVEARWLGAAAPGKYLVSKCRGEVAA